jgi:hypothetical protein
MKSSLEMFAELYGTGPITIVGRMAGKTYLMGCMAVAHFLRSIKI